MGNVTRVSAKLRIWKILLFGSFAATLCFPQATPSLNIGFYYWGGPNPGSISGGVDKIAQMGGHIARLSLSSRMNVDYNVGSGCISNFSLIEAVQAPEVKSALDNPAINVFILTAYDGITFPDCATHLYLQPGIYTLGREKEILREYSDLTYYLYTTYQHTNKRFIISNWESDNDVYCGAAYSYVNDAAFRRTCDTGYPKMYGGNANPEISFEGLKMWFRLRQKGIEDGRQRALAAGVGGIKVYFAPEFCSIHTLREAGFKSTLYDVIPQIKFDYVSYSSYESIDADDPRAQLMEDLDIVVRLVGTDAIIIGEIMTASATVEPRVFITTLQAVMDASLAWGVPYLIYWDLYSDPECPNCGVLNGSGDLTSVGSFFECYLQGVKTCPADSMWQLHSRRPTH